MNKEIINSNQSRRKERMECSADTKLFFDDVYKSGTRGKKQQVDVLQYGRSMIEMLGVLAIVGVLSVGGIAGYSKAMEKFKINKLIDQISHIVTNIRTLYMQQSSYSGLGNNYCSTTKQMGVFPEGVDCPGTEITFDVNPNINAWIVANADNGAGFSLSLWDISKNECVELATKDWGSSNHGFRGIVVTSSVISGAVKPLEDDGQYNYGGWDGYFTRNSPMTVAKAAQYCNCDSDGCGFVVMFK